MDKFSDIHEKDNSELVTLIPQKIENLVNDTSSPKERRSYKMRLAFCLVIDLLPRLGEKAAFEILPHLLPNTCRRGIRQEKDGILNDTIRSDDKVHWGK